MCKGGKRNSFLVGIWNGAWSLWNSNATGSYNYLSIPMTKQCYCSNNIFCWKISVKLLPIYERIYCIRVEHVLLIAKNRAGWKQPRLEKRPAELLWIKQFTCWTSRRKLFLLCISTLSFLKISLRCLLCCTEVSGSEPVFYSPVREPPAMDWICSLHFI